MQMSHTYGLLYFKIDINLIKVDYNVNDISAVLNKQVIWVLTDPALDGKIDFFFSFFSMLLDTLKDSG